MSDSNQLFNSIPQIGRVEWIGVAPAKQAPINTVPSVEVAIESGLSGDHHAKGNSTSKRQVTLIQSEHLPVIASLCHLESVDPALLRRNVVVSGINLRSLKAKRFKIGTAVLEGTGPCAPCSLMEQTLGPGGYQAMRGHGGITAVVLQSGVIGLGDSVHVTD